MRRLVILGFRDGVCSIRHACRQVLQPQGWAGSCTSLLAASYALCGPGSVDNVLGCSWIQRLAKLDELVNVGPFASVSAQDWWPHLDAGCASNFR